ncbi:phospho-N-acetylmuramoyl-pentapeptide-transferase [Furfurilactobacillus milii]|uniref:Phospho-N-acetylmuramoyl-pentapeptide-transferase n=1 Tax=Furfurilactobacillus rossiae TaxID=231049 RepID=A0A7C9MPK1_9LACO|nr:phospho-N-acetylmuramoyl-pentapeptide-transferase [Furfurilactobacillus milii]MYV04628.1 phospho-N-acetylmuramoyl-pentapeptide-transferase [Furfurilactobacillus milii]
MQVRIWLWSLIIAFAVAAIFLPFLIRYFRAHGEGQTIWEKGLSWHEKKNGTPTMGGLMFITASVVATLIVGIWQHVLNGSAGILLFTLVFYGLLGMWDDSIKVFNRQNDGLKAWQKMLGQIVGAIVFIIVFSYEGFSMSLRVPFIGDVPLGVGYVLFAIIWLIGFSNAVNLTDGLDGLATGLSIIAFLAYGIIAQHQRQYGVMVFCLTVVGALAAFLIWNHKPAKIFMGDMGSLALGGALAAVSLLLHHELSLLWVGGVFVIETATVMIQVSYFHITHGKRLFKMTPIHHQFELDGWGEWRIDLTFWAIGAVFAATGVWAMW